MNIPTSIFENKFELIFDEKVVFKNLIRALLSIKIRSVIIDCLITLFVYLRIIKYFMLSHKYALKLK